MDYGAAGCGEAAVPGGDAPDLLQPAEHLLDGIGQRRGVGRGSSCGVGLPWAGCVLQPPSVLGTAPGALIAPWAWPIRIEGAISDRQHAFGNGLDQHLAAVEAGCCLVARGDETRSACRPRSPPRGSRSSAHHPIAAGRDGFPVRPMACASPPFPPEATVRLRIGRIQRHVRWGPPSRGERADQALPHALGYPARNAVAQLLRRALLARRIPPRAARLQHMHDTADHMPVVHPRLAPSLRRQKSSTRGSPRLSAGKNGTKRRICASLGETRIDHPGSAPSSQGNHFDSHRPASLKERYEGGA